jgi:hypothetical protein
MYHLILMFFFLLHPTKYLHPAEQLCMSTAVGITSQILVPAHGGKGARYSTLSLYAQHLISEFCM